MLNEAAAFSHKLQLATTNRYFSWSRILQVVVIYDVRGMHFSFFRSSQLHRKPTNVPRI